MADRFEREARRQGLSDGRLNYPRNPGDFEGKARDAYLDAYYAGQAEARANPGKYAEHRRSWPPKGN